MPILSNHDDLIFLSDDAIPTAPVRSRRFGVGYAHTAGRKTECIDDHERPVMEDILLIKGGFRHKENEDLFCIFDGHDGVTAAGFAGSCFDQVFSEELSRSEEMPREIVEHLLASVDLSSNSSRETLEDRQRRIVVALHSSFGRLHSDLRVVLSKQSSPSSTPNPGGGVPPTDSEAMTETLYGGTTALVAYFDEHDLYIANVGDTRAVLGKDGRAERISVDHNPQLSSERERIEACGGRIQSLRVEGSLAVSRVLGDFDLEDRGVIWHPHIRIIKNFREAGQFVVMASDGLWELVSENEVIVTVQEELDFSAPPSPMLIRRRPPLFKTNTVATATASAPPSPSIPPSHGGGGNSPPSPPLIRPTISISSPPGALGGAAEHLSTSPPSPTRRRRKLDPKLDSESALEASISLVRKAFHQYLSVDNISIVVVRFS